MISPLYQIIIMVIGSAITFFWAFVFTNKGKGILGELIMFYLLKKELSNSEYRIINNLYLKSGEYISQIDHVVVSRYAVFVIETKVRAGTIIGNEYSKTWTQRTFLGTEHTFVNPIHQNYGHQKNLESVLMDFPDIQIVPIVAISGNANLRIFNSVEVIRFANVASYIKRFTTPLISSEQRDAIYSHLLELKKLGRRLKPNHKKILEIKKINQKEYESKVEGNICPECGGKLLERHGKFGLFKGCSYYPTCKFTIGIKEAK